MVLAGLTVVIWTVLGQPIHAECPELPGDHPGHCTNEKAQVQSGLALAGALVSSFPANTVSKTCTQAEDLARPVGPDRLPGARWLRNAEQGPGRLEH